MSRDYHLVCAFALLGCGCNGPTTTPLVPASANIGTYIALGDSISDRGGTGPFFYDQLNDDLRALYPSMTYVHGAVAGAITDKYTDDPTSMASSLVKEQIPGLGSNYPGDVLVTITIGGNDLNGHATRAISGSDAQDRTEYTAHLMSALGTLSTAGRLGSGTTYIVLANIYDFTDGQGDFATVMCGPPIDVGPDLVAGVYANWNAITAAQIAAVPHGTLYDMHADFQGHGYNNKDASQVWFDAASCVHPNTIGHDHIRRSIYQIVTGHGVP